MAIPIKETPVLKGKDAATFITKAQTARKATVDVRNRVRINYQKFSKIATKAK